MAHGHASVMAKPFTPLSLGPVLWLDASDTTTITASSGSVSQWNDKSGNGFNVAQSTSANQPVTGTDTLNSLNVLKFDGTNDTLIRTTATRLVNASNGTFSAFAVFKTNSTSSIAGIVTQDSSTQSRMPQMIRRNAADLETVRVIPSVFVDSAGQTLTTSGTFIGASVMRTSNLQAYVNGSSNGATTMTGTNSTNTSTVIVGNSYTVDPYYWNGLIAEIVVFARAFTNAEMNLIGGYLASKWNSTWTAL